MTQQESTLREFHRALLLATNVPLKEKLSLYSQAARQCLPDVEAGYDRLVERISQNGAPEYAPAVGDEFPDSVLADTEGRLVRLSALLTSGPLVVTFNRGSWCGYCCLQLNALSEAYPTMTALGASAVAIVPESGDHARTLKEICRVPFPILVDQNLGYALSIGLVFWLGEELKRTYLTLGVDLGRFQGNEGWFLPIPATFVVDSDGAILARFIDPDFRRRMPINDIVRQLQELRSKETSAP